MSNQIVISSGAKVRSLEGVLTGTAGIVNSVPLGGANGVATLDALGKVPLSQLPASVVTYLGTWNAATNTPTLTNGVGDVGDLYICNVAGTVNFGAGPITFAAGDWVIYSGTEWQKSAGASGTVTSVAVTESGDALTITGSPITTSGTINIGFAGTGSQYIKGDGTLATFPTTIESANNLITEVYNSTGATLSKGTVVYINGGQGNLPTVTKAQANTEANSSQTYALVREDITNMNNGYVTVAGRLSNIDTSSFTTGATLYLSPSVAGGYTTTKPTSPDHIVYIGIVVRAHPTQGVIEVNIQNTQELAESSDVLISSPTNNQGLFYDSATSLWKNNSIATALGYTPANDALVVHLAGTETITGQKTFSLATKQDFGTLLKNGSMSALAGYTGIGGGSLGNGLDIILNGSGFTQSLLFQTGAGYSYTYPAITGTLALLEGTQTFSGNKTFSALTAFTFLNGTRMDYGLYLSKGSVPSAFSGSTVNLYSDSGNNNLVVRDNSNTSTLQFQATGTYTYTFPASSGTIALSSDLSSYVPYTGATTAVDLGNYDLTVYNIKVGRGAGGISTNTLLSYGGLQANTTGYHNVAIGTNALLLNTTGYGNTAIGSVSSQSITTGFTNTAIGYQTLGNASTASGNTVVGYNAGLNITTGSNNTIIGVYAATATMSNNIILADGQGTIRYQWNGTTNNFTGAATFSSNVTSNGTYFVQNTDYNSGTATGTNFRILLNASSGNTYARLQTYTDGGGTYGNIILNALGGNVGIGTSSPASKLQIEGTGSGAWITINRTDSGTNIVDFTQSGTRLGYVGYIGSDLTLNNATASNTIFSTNNAERMRIYSEGQIGIKGAATTEAAYALFTNDANTGFFNIFAGGSGTATKGIKLKVTSGSSTIDAMTITSGGQIVMGRTTPSGSGRLTVDGDLYLHNITSGAGQSTLKYNYTSTGLVTYDTSSRLLKKDIENLGYGLDDVLKMSAKKYKWKRDDSIDLGFIADEMVEIIPEIVFFSTEMTNETTGVPIGEPLSINYDRLIPVLVKAIQEQNQLISELSAKVTALENK